MGLTQVIATALLVLALVFVIVRQGDRSRRPRASLVLAGLVASPLAFLAGGAVFGSDASPAAPGMTLPIAASPQSVPSGPCGAQSGAAPGRLSHKFRAVPGWVTGSVDNSVVWRQSVQLCGWAASVRDGHTADAVLVFANGRFVGAAKPTISRPDVVRAIGAVGEDSGFSVQLPISLFQVGRRGVRIEVFAVERGTASLLTLKCTTQPREFGC